jgi:hypothetical protein
MRSHINLQRGNIFFALFGAIALVGLLGAAAMTFMRGPLQSAVKITRQNTAEAQMSIAGQVAVMAAASAANNGDCDTDGFVEPLEWRDAGALPKPTGGGLIPNTIGINKKDPWGTEYGYCVWDHGPTTLNAACELTAPGTDMRLEGANSRLFPVVAIISAGPDKTFTTTCRNFATGADRADQNNDGDLLDAGDRELVGKAAPTDDDVIFTYSYEEATGASGGLWQLKSVDPNIATINKSLEVSGGATFQGTGTFQRLAATGSDFLDVLSGLRLPTPTTMPTCNVANLGVLRRNASGNGIEICSAGSVWVSASGPPAATTFSTTTTCTGPADQGKVRYNNVAFRPEYCNGTSWQPFIVSVTPGQLTISPGSMMNLDIVGPCSGGNCPFAFTPWQTFTITNIGGSTTGTLSTSGYITGTNASNFQLDTAATTCDNSITLAPGGSCTVVLRARADGNRRYSGTLNVTAGALSVSADLYGVATNMGCGNGVRGWGGIVVGACTGPGGTEPGTGQIIIQENGCSTSTTNNPPCTGVNGAAMFQTYGRGYIGATSATDGPQNTINMLSYGPSGNWQIAEYCNNLVIDGYDNWYFPAQNELISINLTNNPTISANFSPPVSQRIYSSTRATTDFSNAMFVNVDIAGGATNGGATAGVNFRCFRRHNVPMPTTPTPDADPEFDLSFSIAATGATNLSQTYPPSSFQMRSFARLPSTRVSCPTATIQSINQPVTFTVGGSGSPTVRINNGPEVTSGTLNYGDVIQMWVTSPATPSTTHTATFTIPTDTPASGTCAVTTLAASKVIKVFATSSDTHTGNLGGFAGADAICQTLADNAVPALPAGTYRALLGQNITIPASARLPLDATRFERTDGIFLATDFWDFTDGSIANPINVNENGTRITSGRTVAYVGAAGNQLALPTSSTCGTWTTGASGTYGNINSLADSFVAGTMACSSNQARLYCFGPN